MCAVGSSEVIEAFPFVEFSLQINVAFIAEKLIELLLIGTVRWTCHVLVPLRVLV